MFLFLEILYLVIFLGVFSGLYVLTAIALNWWFKGDRFFGPIPENQILRLDLNGTLYRFVSNIRNQDPEGRNWMWVNPRNFTLETDPRIFRGSPLNNLVWRITGLHKLSWNPFVKVAWYQFRWPALVKPRAEDGPGKELELIWRDELVRSIFYVYDYPIFVKDVEINKSSYTVSMLLMTRMRITNAFTVSVTNQPTGIWIQREIGDIVEKVSAYVFPLEYEQLRQEQEKVHESGLVAALKEDEIFDAHLRAKFGATIDNVDWPTLTVPPEIQAILRKKEDARISNQVLIANAEAYSTALGKRTEADVSRDTQLYAIRTKDDKSVLVAQATAAVEAADKLRKFKGQMLSVNTTTPPISIPLPPPTEDQTT